MAKKTTKTAAKNKRYNYLLGDRYLSLIRRDEIISSLNKDGSWDVKTLNNDTSGKISSQEIYSTINTKEIFGNSKKIFILDEVLPDPVDGFDKFLEHLPSNRYVILMSQKGPHKGSKFYKSIKDDIEEIPPIYDGFSFLNEKDIKRGKKVILKRSDWKGSEEVLDIIMDLCDYDYGKIFEEIEKIRTFLEKDPEDFEEIKDIISNTSSRDVEDIVMAVKERDLNKALDFAAILLNSDESEVHGKILNLNGRLIEIFYLYMFSLLAMKNGKKTDEEIGHFVSSVWHKKDDKTGENKPVNAFTVKSRLFFEKKYIKNRNLEDTCKALESLEESFFDIIYSRGSSKFILNRLLIDVIN